MTTVGDLAKAERQKREDPWKDPVPEPPPSLGGQVAGAAAVGVGAVAAGAGLGHVGRRRPRVRRPHLFDGHVAEPAGVRPVHGTPHFGPPPPPSFRPASRLSSLLRSLRKADEEPVPHKPLHKAAARRRDAADAWLDGNRAAAAAFDEVRRTSEFDAKHPRGDHGRFAASEGGGDQQPLAHASNVLPLDQRRTRATMPSFYRQASRTQPQTQGVSASMPKDYTGATVKELPVGSFKVAELKFHPKPKSLGLEDHVQLRKRLVKLVTDLQGPTIERGLTQVARRGERKGEPLIPPGTSKLAVTRAFNHGAFLALHGFGIGTYDFRMDDALKEELTPLVPFIRYAQRRVQNTMLATEKGQWRPYREEHGVPFADRRRDKVTGEVRLRVLPNQQLIKAFDPSAHPREHDGKFSRKTGEIVGRTAGGVGGALIGQRLGAKHGPAIGAKAGTVSAKGFARVHDTVSPPKRGDKWKRWLSHEASEMHARDLGRKLGGSYGRVIGGVALGLGGYLAGGAAGSVADHQMRRRRAKKAGRLEQFNRLNAVGGK